MEKILIVSNKKYPNGDAGSVRQHTFAKLFQACGYNPLVIGLGTSTNFKNDKYEGINYISFRAEKNNKINRILNLLFYEIRLRKILKNDSEISKILVVSVVPNVLFFLKRYAKKKNITLIHDSVEWYTREEKIIKKLSYGNIVNNSYNKKWVDRSFKIIAISKYLENHFLGRNIECTRIPVIMDINNMSFKKTAKGDKLVLVYAGSVGNKKDHLHEILYGMASLNEKELRKIELRVLGVEKDQARDILEIKGEVMEKITHSVNFLGRVSREEVLRNLKDADFTVLLRSPEQRSSKAGFPTKVVESLATATPVILNLTSDLGEYLSNMIDAIYVDECSADSFAIAIRKAMVLDSNELDNMKLAARATAEKYFDYRKYVPQVKAFI